MRNRPVITGMGVITPFGGITGTFNAFFAREPMSAISHLPKEFEICPTQIGGIVDLRLDDWFEPRTARRMASRSTKPTQFSYVAIQQALMQANLLHEGEDVPPHLGERTGIYIGTGIGASELIGQLAVDMYRVEQTPPGSEERETAMQDLIRSHLSTAMTVLPDASGYLPTIRYGIQGFTECGIKACATGAGSIWRAAREIADGFADIMIAGGTDSLSPVDVMAFAVYAKSGALSRRNDEPTKASRPFDQGHDGFVPSEGAGIVVIESLKHALSRGATPLAELVGFGERTDARGATDPDKASQMRAMHMALQMAGKDSSEIQTIKAHGTSTIAGDSQELEAIKGVFGSREDLYVFAPKSKLGHTLGASGAIETILLVEGMRRKEIPSTDNLEDPIPEAQGVTIPTTLTPTGELDIGMADAFGFGGQNVSLILRLCKN